MASAVVGVGSTLSGSISAVNILTTPRPQVSSPLSQGWRPPQWKNPAVVTITVPMQQTNSLDTTGVPSALTGVLAGSSLSTPAITAPLTYIFDAVLALDHEQSLTKTQHPVQTGAAVSSHAYLEPASVVMDILMSDVSQGYVSVSQTASPYYQTWPGATSGGVGAAPSRSVSAYKTILKLQAQRVPLTITTRLRTYYNMLISHVAPREDSKTVKGLRMRVTFDQVFIAGTQTVPISALTSVTNMTGLGSIGTAAVPTTVSNQYNITQATTPVTPVDIPGAGTYSSYPTTSVLA